MVDLYAGFKVVGLYSGIGFKGENILGENNRLTKKDTASIITFTFIHLADAFIQSNLQKRTIEAIKTNKRGTTWKCYDKSRLA